MIIYLGTFAVSTLMIYVSETVRDRRLRRILILAAIILPSIIAGCRADTVGTDIRTYGKAFYQRAYSFHSFIDYYSLILSYGVTDIGYFFVTFLCSRISANYHLGLFVYSLLTNGIIYLSFAKLKKMYGVRLWMGMLLYYLTMYNISLNAIRQFIAVAFVLYAFTFLLEKRLKHYLILCLIAFLFHSSGIIGFALWPMYIILKEGRTVSLRKQLTQFLIFITAFIMLFAFGPFMVRQLVAVGIFRTNYLNYLSGGNYDTNVGVSWMTVAPHLLYAMIACFFIKRLNNKVKDNLFLFMCSGLCFVLSFGTIISEFFIRSLYFFMPLESLYPMLIEKCFTKKSHRAWIFIVIMIAFMFWIRDYAIFNYHQTLPYIFSLE